MRRFAGICGIFLVWLLLPATGFTAGTFLPGNGTRAMGKAGAVVATGEDGDAVFHNPANLGRLRGFGLRFDNTLSIQELSFQRAPEGGTTFEKVDKATSPTYIPMLSIWYNIKNLGPGSLTLAIFGYGPHGASGYKYPEEPGQCKPASKGVAEICNPMPEPGPQRLTRIEASNPLIYAGIAAAYEWRIREDFSLRLGGTFKFAYLMATQRQAAIAAGALYVPNSPRITSGEVIMKLSGTGYTFTGDIGFSMTTPVGISLGISVLLPMTVQLSGTLDVQVNETFGNLASVEGNQIEATTSFPLVIRSGIGWSNKVFSFEVALISELWSVQKEISVRPQNIELEVLGNRVKVPNFAIPQQLRDSFSLRVGMEYNLFQWVYLRMGWLMETGATPTNELSVSTLDYPKHAITGGISVNIPGGLTIDFSVIHSFAREFNITDSPLRPVDVSPENFRATTPPGPVTNGQYRYAITAVSFAIKGNWLK